MTLASNRRNRVSHHGRSPISRPSPVYVEWRVQSDVSDLRGKKLSRQLRVSFQRCHEKEGFNVTDFSVHGAEVQMIVEADDMQHLSRGMQGLGVSMAKRINFSSRRRGPVFEDRFHARALRTPREVAEAIDQLVRAVEFRGRLEKAASHRSDEIARVPGPPLVSDPHTWLMRLGRLRAALLSPIIRAREKWVA